MSNQPPKQYSAILPAYFFVVYIILFLTNLLFLFKITDWSISAGLLIFSALIVYPFFSMLTCHFDHNSHCVADIPQKSKTPTVVDWSGCVSHGFSHFSVSVA